MWEDSLLEHDLLEIQPENHSLVVELAYASSDNFAGIKAYHCHRAFIHKEVLPALIKVAESLKPRGFQLKILDAYRPFSVQERFWKVCPNGDYLAQPLRHGGKLIKGSQHNRGIAVDCTLLNIQSGEEAQMPSAFDEFSKKAHRNWSQRPHQETRAAQIMEQAFYEYGFKGHPREWWHFDYKMESSPPLLDIPLPPS